LLSSKFRKQLREKPCTPHFHCGGLGKPPKYFYTAVVVFLVGSGFPESSLRGAAPIGRCNSTGHDFEQENDRVRRLAYISVGAIATLLAIAGVILPGLPATPFLLVALWAFSRSSDRLLSWLDRVPLLREALVEARRFEERGTIRREVKITAVAVAWGSVLFTGFASNFSSPVLLGVVTAAALAGSIAMWWIPTDI
jgi:hypothetical protein